MKLKRWIFKEKNYNPTVMEQLTLDINLEESTKAALSEFFLKHDSELRFGINRKYLLRVYKILGFFKKAEEKESFLQASHYYRRRNQKIAGVHLREYLLIFKQVLETARKQDPAMSEQVLLAKFLEEMAANLAYVKKWETVIEQKRKEFKKSLPELEGRKKEFIKIKLSESPLMELDDLEKILGENGLFGLSLREKVDVLRTQQALMVTKLQNMYKKANLDVSGEKAAKRKKKVKDLEDKLKNHRNMLEEFRKDFKGLYREEI